MTMRELKFRAWNGNEIYMSPPMAAGLHHLANWFEAHSKFSPLMRNKESVITQYIGIKDKNRKEIYEGDRLHFTIKFADVPMRAFWSESGFTGVVKWKDVGYFLDDVVFNKMFDSNYVFSMQGRDFDQKLLDRYSKIKSASFEDSTDLEVTGNIYQHPHLLNQQS